MNRLHSVRARSLILLGCEGQGWQHNSPPGDSQGHKNLPTSSFRVRNSSGCDRQDAPIRQRDRQSQGETTGGCLCGKLTRAAWPAPLFSTRQTPLSPEANANQPGSQGCDSQQVMTSASWSLYQMGTCESGMAKESQARWKISPWSLQTLTPTGQNTERRADWSPTLSEGRAGSFGLSLIPRTYLQG